LLGETPLLGQPQDIATPGEAGAQIMKAGAKRRRTIGRSAIYYIAKKSFTQRREEMPAGWSAVVWKNRLKPKPPWGSSASFPLRLFR